MAEAGLAAENVVEAAFPAKAKGKKERACPRTRRRLRKSAAAEHSHDSDCRTYNVKALKSPRWVRVSRSDEAARWEGQLLPEKFDGLVTRRGRDAGAHEEAKKDAAVRSFDGSPSLPSTPSQHLLPVSLLSPAISSNPQCESEKAAGLSTIPTQPEAKHARNGGQNEDGSHKWTFRRTQKGHVMGDASCGRTDTKNDGMAPVYDGTGLRTNNYCDHGVGILARPIKYQPSGADEMPETAIGPELLAVDLSPALRLDWPEEAGWKVLRDQKRVPEDGATWKSWNGQSEGGLLSDENKVDLIERKQWQEWARHAAEHERQRRIKILENMDLEENRERQARRAWALSAMDEEQRRRAGQQGTNWFQGTISSVDLDYEVVCPYTSLGCRHICLRTELDEHLAKECHFNKEPRDSDFDEQVDACEYEVVCPNTILGCDHSCSRSSLTEHLENCRFGGPDIKEEKAERARSLQMVLQQAEEERARRVAHDTKGDWQSDSLALKTRQFLHRLLKDQMKTALVLLHKEILDFAARCRRAQEERRRALEDLRCRLEVVIGGLWPGTVVLPFGSYASGTEAPHSDVDLVVIQTGGRKGVTPNTPSRKEMTGARTPLRGSSTVEMKNHLPGAESIAGQRSPCHVEQGTPLTPGSTPRQYQEQNERAMGVRRKASFTSAQDPKAEKSKRSPGASWKQCRGGGHMSSFSDVSTRIQDLADYLQLHAPFIEVVKVLTHARVPILKAIATSGGGEKPSIGFEFKVDISIDGPTHTGLATSAFVSYLADHLPNLVPLTIVLKSLLQRDGLNDPFTGGLSSYGLVLMVAFALLRRDHFPPSPRGVCFADPRVSHRSASNLSSDLQSTPSADDVAQDQSSDELLQCQSLAEASSDGDHFTVPPSPDHADGSTSGSLFSPKIHGSPTRRSDMLSAGKQRGFWQRSSVLEGASDGTTGTFVDWSRAGTTKIRQPQAFAGDDGNMSCWDRPRQQHWLGSRTARAILMQDSYAGAPTTAPITASTQNHLSSEDHEVAFTALDGSGKDSVSISSVPPPPPPPLPRPVTEAVPHPLTAPPSPYITSGHEPVLGELLLDVLHLFGEDFDVAQEGFSVRDGGFRFRVHGEPPHPQAGDPIVIEDPLNCMNNVGRSSFGIGQVQRALFEALTTLKATMVRVNQDGKEVLGSDSSTSKTNTGMLRHICGPYDFFDDTMSAAVDAKP